jgi:hypothetical protein
MKKADEKVVGKSVFVGNMADNISMDNIMEAMNDGNIYGEIEDIEWDDDRDGDYVVEVKVVRVFKRKITLENVQ